MKKNKNIILFFASDFISGFAISMSLISFNWIMLQQTQSNIQVSYLTTINILSSFLFSIVGGMLTDRYKRKPLLSASYILSAFILLLIFGFIQLFGFNTIYLYFCSIINGAIWSVYLLISKSLLQELINERSDFIKGTSFIEISLQAGTLSAGFFSGILLKYIGLSMILMLNIIAFFICSLLINNINYIPAVDTNKNTKSSNITNIIDGYKYLLSNNIIFLIGIISVIPLTVTALFNVILPGFVYEQLNGDSFTYGFSDMLYGVGAIISGILITRIAENSNKQKRIYIAFISAIFIFTPMFFKNSIRLFGVCCLIFGIANVYIKIVCNAQIMTVVSPVYMGRFLSMITAISLLMQTAGTLIIGYVIDQIGPIYGFLSIAIILVLGLLIYIYMDQLLNKMRSMKELS